MEQQLSSWRQTGRVSIWRYLKAPRRYDGWHFSADRAGCQSLLDLLALLAETTEPAHRTLSLTDPASVGSDQIFWAHDEQVVPARKLRLQWPRDEAGSLLHPVDDVLTMSLTKESLADFADAVADVRNDKADFGVGFGNPPQIINFWHWPAGR